MTRCPSGCWPGIAAGAGRKPAPRNAHRKIETVRRMVPKAPQCIRNSGDLASGPGWRLLAVHAKIRQTNRIAGDSDTHDARPGFDDDRSDAGWHWNRLLGRHASGGAVVRARAALVREIAACGHALGNHTDTHPNLIWLGRDRIRQELMRCQRAVLEASGRRPLWVRPPYGYRGPQLRTVVCTGGWRGVALWSRNGFDWKPQPAHSLIARLGQVQTGDIVLLHDGAPEDLRADRWHVVRALEYWLPRWLDRGWRLVTLDDVTTAAFCA